MKCILVWILTTLVAFVIPQVSWGFLDQIGWSGVFFIYAAGFIILSMIVCTLPFKGVALGTRLKWAIGQVLIAGLLGTFVSAVVYAAAATKYKEAMLGGWVFVALTALAIIIPISFSIISAVCIARMRRAELTAITHGSTRGFA